MTTTTITYDLLKAAKPGAYNSAASALQTVIETFEQATADLNVNVYQQIEYTWSGTAASTAISSIGLTVADYQATLAYLNRFAGLLRSAYEGIADAQAYVSAAETIATNNGWTLGDDGEAEPQMPAGDHGRVNVAVLWQSMEANPGYAEMQQLIAQGLKTAQAVNDQIAAAMADPEQYGKGADWQKDAASAQDSATKLASTLESTDEIPAAGTDPAEVLAWWTALGQASPAVQTQLVKDQPNLIGPLDPAEAVVPYEPRYK